MARLGAAPAAPATPQQALQLYELWVNCAEEAYAATVHREDFGRLQAELANTSAALLVEQRRQAESLVRAFGLATRNEVDALYAQMKELRRELAELVPDRAGRAADSAPDSTGSGAKRARRDAGPAARRGRARTARRARGRKR